MTKRERIRQARAIYYTQRQRQLDRIEELGLWPEYAAFCRGHQHHRIAAFIKAKGIQKEMARRG